MGDVRVQWGNTGGRYRLPAEAPFEPAAAAEGLAGDEFIFDVQTHMVDPAGPCLEHCDHALVVPASDSAHVQEAHQVIIHLLCEGIEWGSELDS